MRKFILALLVATLSLGVQTQLGAAAPAAKPLHFKADLGVQDTAFGKLHLYDGLWPVHTVSPHYPDKERRARIIGEVTMEVLVNADGTVKDAAVKTSSGNANLDAAALAMVHLWKYPVLETPTHYVTLQSYNFMVDG